jgi:hypothetical protein
MALKLFELFSVVLLMIVGGLYWGPWVALSRSMATFEPGVFLAVVKRMNRNMEPVMTVLMPVALVSTLPVLVLSYGQHRQAFYLTLAGLALVVEVPIVKQMDTWTTSDLPDGWQALRDRWGAFHLLRVGPAVAGLVLLLVGVIF